MGHNNSTQSPWFQTILTQTLLHITHLVTWPEMCTGKRKGYSNTQCKATAAHCLNGEAVSEEPLIPILNFQVFLLFLPSNPSSVHRCCHTICNLFSISHLCINSTSAPARRGSLSLLELPALLWLTTVTMMTERQNLPLLHIRQVLCLGKQQLSSRWPYSSFILHWPSDATVAIAHVRTRTRVLQFLPKHLRSLHCSLCCFHTWRCQDLSPSKFITLIQMHNFIFKLNNSKNINSLPSA